MNDFRVPGTPSPQMVDYKCPICDTEITDEIQPQCPNDGTLMEPIESSD